MHRTQAELIAYILLGFLAVVSAQAQDEPFKGKIGKTLKDSKEYWPTPVAPPEGAPNVLVWLIDDMGGTPAPLVD